MTDEVSQPDSTPSTNSGQTSSPQAAPPPESAPTPQPAPPVAATPAPAPPEPVIPPEAVKEISQVITAGLQETLATPEPTTPTQPETPAQEVPEIEVPEPPKTQTPTALAPLPAPSAPKQSAGAHMRQVVRNRKQARLEKIIEMATEKRVIVNGDVQKLLNVSDPTATRYLKELVKAGRLNQPGVRRSARYELI